MSEQRRGLGNACVLTVPAEYACASSVCGDHQQQYDPYRPKLTTFEEKDFPPIFSLSQKIFFTVTHFSEIISPD